MAFKITRRVHLRWYKYKSSFMKFQESNCSDLVLHDSSFINRDLSSEGKKKKGGGGEKCRLFWKSCRGFKTFV